MNIPALNTAARAVLRIEVGFLLAAQSWQKFNEITITGTHGAFTQMDVVTAGLVAPVVATLELVGGISPVHCPAGVFVEADGFELVLMLGASALAVALAGPGKLSLDNAFFGRASSKLRILA